jgi:hypothetical protein
VFLATTRQPLATSFVRHRIANPFSERLAPASANHRFKFQKRSQLFIRTHNETLSVVAVRVSNEDCSPVRIHA